MSHDETMQKFRDKREHQLGMGGPERLAKRKAAGKLNVRERLEYLYDPGTFQEIGLFSHSFFKEVAEETPTDGKIIGSGKINGREFGTVANDLTIKGASSSYTNSRKIEHMRALSAETGLPLVFLAESSGQRMPDGMGSFAMTSGGQNTAQYRRLREAPWLSVALGPCFGSSSWYCALSDITIMLEGAAIGVVSPKVTQMSTGETTPMEELCGWRLHAEELGTVDAVADSEQRCIDIAKVFLSFFPCHAGEPPPRLPVSERKGNDRARDVLAAVPEERNRVYDVRQIIGGLVDGGEYLELKPRFAKPVVTAFARLDGRPVGFVANNPKFGAGAMDGDSCSKVTSFLVMCDSYNIPIVTLIDTPGFMIGKHIERQKLFGKVMNWMNALSLVTVPKLTVVIRKLYGQAYLNMGGGKYSDVYVGWPTADISFMDPEPGINVVYGLKREDDPERFEELLEEMTADSEAYAAAGIFGLHDVIDPADTRDYLIRMLEVVTDKRSGGVGKHLLHNWPTTV
jgi:acetyl-CoA carboxylase carboxyltransferase component